jgi:hypothetical protein
MSPRDLALIHLVQVIGEAARQVSREFTVLHPEVPRENIIGMRHEIVHDYLGVDEDHRLAGGDRRPLEARRSTRAARSAHALNEEIRPTAARMATASRNVATVPDSVRH